MKPPLPQVSLVLCALTRLRDLIACVAMFQKLARCREAIEQRGLQDAAHRGASCSIVARPERCVGTMWDSVYNIFQCQASPRQCTFARVMTLGLNYSPRRCKLFAGLRLPPSADLPRAGRPDPCNICDSQPQQISCLWKPTLNSL